MKYCSNCGAAMDDDSRFCTECGAEVELPPAPVVQPVCAAAPKAEKSAKEEKAPRPGKKKKKGLPIILCVVVLLVGALVACWALGLFDGAGGENEDDDSTRSTQGGAPGENLVEHEYDGLHFYLDDDFQELEGYDGRFFASDDLEIQIASFWASELDASITSAKKLAQWYTDRLSESGASLIDEGKSNGTYYITAKAGSAYAAVGFYEEDGYCWILTVGTEEEQADWSRMIGYATLGQIEDDEIPSQGGLPTLPTQQAPTMATEGHDTLVTVPTEDTELLPTMATEPEEVACLEYTVTIESSGGRPMMGIEVCVYNQDNRRDEAAYGLTDLDGCVSFTLREGPQYIVVLENVPLGYDAASEYWFRSEEMTITLRSELISGEDMNRISDLVPGDVMFDFTVTTAEGETLTLSDVLEQKKAVMLNFWFSTCGPCAREFPAIETAYSSYRDQVEIIALNPIDTTESVAEYQQQMGLSFPMASCHSSWPEAFGIYGYPTTVIVDRYGVICLMETGAVTDPAVFSAVFEYFCAGDYEQQLFGSMEELL